MYFTGVGLQVFFMFVRFQVLTTASMTTVLWDFALFSLVETGRRFRGANCLHHRPDDRTLKRRSVSASLRPNFSEDNHSHVFQVSDQKERNRLLTVSLNKPCLCIFLLIIYIFILHLVFPPATQNMRNMKF
jgi:hypothetical protein